MRKLGITVRILSLLAACGIGFAVQAQSLPATITISGNIATARIGPGNDPLADFSLTFDEPRGLSAAALGISARLVDINDPQLVARLPPMTAIPAALPLLVTVAPPTNGGLEFDRTVAAELHTHALPYTAGSRLRVFKAPLGGAFRDISNQISPGSVRARGTTGGFSEFLVLVDTRATSAVIADKFVRLRAVAALLPRQRRAVVNSYINSAEGAVADGDYSRAITILELLRAFVASRAGVSIPETWLASGGSSNIAGGLLAGASSLQYSIGYLRDFGD